MGVVPNQNTITNIDLFEELYKAIKNSEDISEIYKEYGGSAIYIPSYKTTCRNDAIINDYKDGSTPRELMKKYDLSQSQVYTITKEVREPTLF